MLRITKTLSVAVLLLSSLMLASPVVAQDLKHAIKLTTSEQFDAAGQEFTALIKQSPLNGDLFFYYGDNFIMEYFSDTLNGSLKEATGKAQEIYNAGAAIDPANPLPLVGLAKVAMLNKDMAKAQAYNAQIMALLPSKANKALKMDPARHANVLIQMAANYVDARVRDTAAIFPLLRQAEKLDPKNPELYIVKGDVYILLLNDGSNAIANYNFAQGLDPKSPEAKLRVGLLWLRARNYKDALQYYQDVVKIDSTFAPAYRELGSLLARAGRQEEAQKNYIKFLALSGGNTTARKQFVNTLIELKDYNAAIAQLDEIMKQDTTDTDLYRALTYSYFETQQYDKALAASKKFFTRSKPEKIRPQDYAYYGRALAKMKLDTLAPNPLLRAYSMDTTKPELISEAAFCWTKAKRYDKAMELYQRKIDMGKGTAMDYYNLGKVFYSLGDYTKSDTNLAIFNTMQPEYIAGWVWRARTRSNIDSTSKLGLAKPIYDIILEKTQSDTAKYVKERMESFYYLAYFNFLQYNATKTKDYAVKAVEYGNRVIAIDPNDDKALKAKQIVDVLKDKVK
jgi:tetratricopeptide (TPR) repeat protein